MRICAKCKKNLPLSGFSKKNFLYHHSRCKKCIREDYKKWYKKNGRNRLDNYKEAILHWQYTHWDGVLAQAKLRYAVKTGKIIKPILCSKCNKKTRLSAHHKNYSKPYEVLWLCSSCHKLEHNNNKIKFAVDKQ